MSIKSERDEFEGYTIEPRGPGGALRAVLKLAEPKPQVNENGSVTLVKEWVFGGNGLTARIANREAQGKDASFSREALTTLRAKSDAEPKPC
jgi:hypothetical protein